MLRGRARQVLLGVVAALLVVGLGVGAYVLAARPPRPALPYPAGHALTDVRGNCESGGEVFDCAGQGPRSFLTVSAAGDPRKASAAMFEALLADGWTQDDKGRTAADHAGGGAPEDIQPVYCREGCIGLFRLSPEGYVLAWWDRV